MSDNRVATLAIWDVIGRRWVAGLTSEHVERIVAVRDVMSVYCPTFFALLNVPDDVEAIEAAVAALEPPPDAEVFEMYLMAISAVMPGAASEADLPDEGEPLH